MSRAAPVCWVAGFVVWQFVLRRLGVWLPARLSARVYVSLVAWPAALALGRTWLPVAAVISVLAWRTRVARPGGTRAHFDRLAPDYAEQLSPSARKRVIERKTAFTLDALERAGIRPGGRVVDVGCGHGWYMETLAAGGYRVVGIDVSPAQLVRAAQAHARGAPLVAASALALPFRPDAMDAAFAVNVLHHLASEAEQAGALREVARTVRRGGAILLHEINTRNPLFRLYMVYIFPLWKRIDLGTERWLDPRRLPVAPATSLERVRCYTFLPDFVPPAAYRLLAPLEARFERSRLAAWSAHFTAEYRRTT